MENMGPSNLRELGQYIKHDLGYYGKKPVRSFIGRYLFEAGFKFVFWLRVTRWLYIKKNALMWIARAILKHYSYKYQFDISYKAQIGPDLQIAHFGYIVVPSNATLGTGCRLRPGVVIGKKLTEDTNGAVIGNQVDFGVGCKVIGNVTIGDNVTIGANAVVTKDIPSDVVIAGVPAKIVREKHKG